MLVLCVFALVLGGAWSFPPVRPRACRERPASSRWSSVEELRERADGVGRRERRSGPPGSALERFGLDRTSVLRGIVSVDRGEFRWEFLTPWVDRDLTRVDKVIICSAFIGVAIVAQELFEPATRLTQHLSYVANFFSYTIGNQVGYVISLAAASNFGEATSAF